MKPMLGRRQLEEVRLKSRGMDRLSPNLSGQRKVEPSCRHRNLPRYVSLMGPGWRTGLAPEESGAWVQVAEGFAGQAKLCRPILKATGSHGRFGKNRMAWLTHTHTHTHTHPSLPLSLLSACTHTHTHSPSLPLSLLSFRPLCFLVVLLAAAVLCGGSVGCSCNRQTGRRTAVHIEKEEQFCKVSPDSRNPRHMPAVHSKVIFTVMFFPVPSARNRQFSLRSHCP